MTFTATYSFSDGSFNATVDDAAVTATPMASGSGLALFTTSATDTTGYATTPVLKVQSLSNNTAMSSAMTNNAGFYFTVSRSDGAAFTPQTLSFKVARGGGAGTRRFAVNYIASGVTTALIGGTTPDGVRPTMTTYSFDVSPAGLVTSITFYIYVVLSTTSYSIEFDDVAFTGATAVPTTTVTASSPVSWSVRQAVAGSQATSWGVLQTLQSDSAGLSWNVRAVAGTALSTSWGARQGVTAGTSTGWAVRRSVTASTGTSWSTRTGVVGSVPVSWNVLLSVIPFDGTGQLVTLPSVTANTRIPSTIDKVRLHKVDVQIRIRERG